MEETKATQYITITVAEYVTLTKAAAMLEVICHDTAYGSSETMKSVQAAVEAMTKETVQVEKYADGVIIP